MVIDLDVVPPSRPAADRRLEVRRARPTLIVVLTVLLALLLGSAGVRPRVRDLPLVTTVTTASVAWSLTGTTLYTLHSRTSGRLDVVARSPATGEVRWQRDMEWWSGIPSVVEAGPTLVVTGPDGVETNVLDSRTGKDGADPGTYTTALAAGDRIVLYDDSRRRLALYDPIARRNVWQHRFEPRLYAAVATGPYLVTVDDTGVATALHLSDGAPAATTGEAIPLGTAPGVRVIDSRIYLLGDQTATSLTVPELRTRWTTVLPLPRVAVPCGTRICVSGGTGVSALDPETGHITWNRLDWTGGENDLVRAVDGHGVLIDPESGEAKADLGPGLPVGDLLLRPGTDGVSVVEWATGRLRGHLPGVNPNGCRRTGDHLGCQRADGTLTVWRLS